MKKSIFILATLCFCSNGFPQTIKNNQADYEKDILNKGAPTSFLSDFSDWRKFRNNEELNKEVFSTGSPTTPTSAPSTTPTSRPSTTPTSRPSTTPTSAPSTTPTSRPSTTPTSRPSTTPTSAPSTTPTSAPSTTPTSAPSTTPTSAPSTTPTSAPTTTPTSLPPITTTPRTGGAVTLSSTSFSTFGILILVHLVCKYIYR